MNISKERLEKALMYLAQTDPKIARAKARMEEMQDFSKIVYARCYLDAVGDTVADRTQSAYTDERYVTHVQELGDAVGTYEDLRHKRHTQEIIVEVWRTIQANLRRGNI